MLIGFGRLDDDREDVDFVDVDPLDDFDEEEDDEDEDDDDERRFERDPLRLYCFAGAASTSSSEGISNPSASPSSSSVLVGTSALPSPDEAAVLAPPLKASEFSPT